MCGILLIAEAVHSEDVTHSCGTCADREPASGKVSACAHGDAAAAPAACSSTCAGAFLPGLRSRGPDHVGACSVTLTGGTHEASSGSAGSGPAAARLLLAASLLQLRGAAPVAPPLVADGGSVLCFNGELFGGLDAPEDSNDGAALLDALEAAAGEGAVPCRGQSC